MKKEEVIQALDCVVEQGYSLGQRVKRTLRLARSLKPHFGNTMEHKIQATIYSIVLQHVMSQIFHDETRNLESPLSQNYYTEAPPR